MLFAGPTITFRDYMDFIEGNDMDVNRNKAKVRSDWQASRSTLYACRFKLGPSATQSPSQGELCPTLKVKPLF